jgi:hypothetical protein
MTKIKRIDVMESTIDDTEMPDIPLSDTNSGYSISHLVTKSTPRIRRKQNDRA